MIKTENLTKTFGSNIALDNLNFEVKKGELFGFVGPDGAGKTTTMRLLAGIMAPSSGQAHIAGLSVKSQAGLVREKIGYMPQRFGLYEDLTVMENILFYADLYEVAKKERAKNIERLLDFGNLTPFKKRLAGNLSGGMKQKLGLACALIHTPEVLLLDEPTCGVDPVSRRDFWKILYELLKEGITIFVSTAYLDEAERCNRVGLLYKGKILMIDSPENIKKNFGFTVLEARVDDTRRAYNALKDVDGVRGSVVYGEKIHIKVLSSDTARAIASRLNKEKITVKSIKKVAPSLEDVFIEMTESER